MTGHLLGRVEDREDHFADGDVADVDDAALVVAHGRVGQQFARVRAVALARAHMQQHHVQARACGQRAQVGQRGVDVGQALDGQQQAQHARVDAGVRQRACMVAGWKRGRGSGRVDGHDGVSKCVK